MNKINAEKYTVSRVQVGRFFADNYNLFKPWTTVAINGVIAENTMQKHLQFSLTEVLLLYFLPLIFFVAFVISIEYLYHPNLTEVSGVEASVFLVSQELNHCSIILSFTEFKIENGALICSMNI